ncbi:MAG: hypothetical protein LBO08_01215 [Rickettsiales bacterium]|jgi:hypothetical protein|nr:hypothetical protein [Rickettsiales bacterium]
MTLQNIYDDIHDEAQDRLDYHDYNNGFYYDNPVKNEKLVHGISFPKNNINTLPELFTEWFLLDSSSAKTVDGFLAAEQLDSILSVDDFYALLGGNAVIDDLICQFVSQILPFTTAQLHYMRAKVLYRAPHAMEIRGNPDIILPRIKGAVKERRQLKQERRAQYIQKYNDTPHARENRKIYYIENRQKILARVKKYRTQNRETVILAQKNWYERNKNKISKAGKDFRRDHPDLVRERRKKMPSAAPEIVAKYNKDYRARNKTKLSLKKKAKYLANRDDIRAAMKEKRILDKTQNPEKLAMQSDREKQWRAVHRAEQQTYHQLYNIENSAARADTKKKCYQANKAAYNANNSLNYLLRTLEPLAAAINSGGGARHGCGSRARAGAET